MQGWKVRSMELIKMKASDVVLMAALLTACRTSELDSKIINNIKDQDAEELVYEEQPEEDVYKDAFRILPNMKAVLQQYEDKGYQDDTQEVPDQKVADVFGDPVDLAIMISEELTGKKVAKGIEFTITKKLPEGVSGQQSFSGDITSFEKGMLNLIEIRPDNYMRMLATTLHEIGHAYYRGFENGEDGRYALAMEEAGAESFMTAGLMHLAKTRPRLQKIAMSFALSERDNGVGIFIQETKYADDNAGFAIAEATARHFHGDYARAFNYLADKLTFGALHPDIKKRLQAFKKEKKRFSIVCDVHPNNKHTSKTTFQDKKTYRRMTGK